MTTDYLIALFTFCFVLAFTPGPNNIMLMASGINFGVRRTLPHAAGIQFGWPLMVLVVGLGLGQFFVAVPQALTILKYASAAYMLWLAWKIALSRPASGSETQRGEPMTFLQAALFQWVNGKAWTMAVSTVAAFAIADNPMLGVLAVVACYFVAGLFSISAWVLFGAGLRAVLTDPRWYRAINIMLALSLVASLWPMLNH
jgi:threonine/homoserine/homoserine lactone efflux protein